MTSEEQIQTKPPAPSLQPGRDFIYRGAEENDRGFIVSSWTKSQRDSDATAFVENHIYYPWQYARINRIIRDANVTIIADPADSTHVIGYLVWQMFGDVFCLHYLYIKLSYRNMGLAKSAIRYLYPQFGQVPIVLTHIDRTKVKLIKNKLFPKDSNQEYLIKQTSCFVRKRRDYQLLYQPFIVKD